ncbi:MAG: hypothetical protein IKF19_05110 [Bacilli bacterium]|nr:hypothetical protein [Bacilli bacterium]
MTQTKQKTIHILDEINERNKKEMLYSISEDIRENYREEDNKRFNYDNIVDIINNSISSISERINKEINKSIAANSNIFTSNITYKVIITNYLIKAMEKELNKESDIHLIYSDDFTAVEKFLEYFNIEKIGIERLVELLKEHKIKLIQNLSIQDIVDNNRINIIKDIENNKDLHTFIYKIVDEALDFDFCIKDEEEYIESIKEDGPEGDEEFYNWSINYQNEIIDYLKKLKQNKKHYINAITTKLIDMNLDFNLNYIDEDNISLRKELYNSVLKQGKTINFTPTIENIMDYYERIQKDLLRNCEIIPYYEATEYIVKRSLDDNYKITFDYRDEMDISIPNYNNNINQYQTNDYNDIDSKNFNKALKRKIRK